MHNKYAHNRKFLNGNKVIAIAVKPAIFLTLQVYPPEFA